MDSRHFEGVDLDNAFAVDIKRARFIKQIANLTFNDGVLTQFELDRPSPASELAGLVVDVVKLPFTAVSEILQLRVNVGANEVQDLQNQVAALEAKETIRELSEESEATDEPL